MSLHLVFSWFADTGAWPEHPGAGLAVVDEAVVGPLRLLDHAETMLGLGAPAVPGVKRIAVYRRKLENAGAERFWSASFAKDSWSTARELLKWRDELVEGGWRPEMPISPKRLTDLAAAELAGPSLPAGLADRLHVVLAALADKPQLPLTSIELIDVRDDLPAGWRRLLSALEACGVLVTQRATRPASDGDCDLSRLLAPFNAADQRVEISGDGTVSLLTADSELVAAEALAAWLAAEVDANSGLVFVLGGDSDLLDHALRRVGLPRLGRSAASPHRALLQVLPLAFALAWAPPDPNNLLDFLLLPVSPLPRWVANMLARCVAETPGVGGPDWIETFDAIASRFVEEVPDKPADKRAADIARWRAFVEPQRHDPTEGMLRPAALVLANSVNAWANARLGASNDVLFRALATAASDLAAAIDATEADSLDRLLIERMIEQVVGAGVSDPSAAAEAAPWRVVSHPGAIWGPARTVVWWRFEDNNEISARAVWDFHERDALKEAGCPLDDPALAIRRIAASWEGPVHHAREKLLLVRPATAGGEEVKTHPLWHSIVAGRKELEARIGARAEVILEDPAPRLAGRVLARQKVESAHLPRRLGTWSPSEAAINAQEFESATSLAALLSCPFNWTLHYVAGLKPSARQSLPREDALFGTLAHKIAEDLFKPGAPPDPDETARLSRVRLEEILPQMAATLLLPGAARDLAAARRSIPEALGELARFLHANALSVVATEQKFEDPGVLDVQTGVRGAIDLLAEDNSGDLVVIDLKWQKRDKYRRAEIADGVAIQLAVYARHIGGAADVATGYFMLQQKRFVTSAGPFSGPVVAVDGESPLATWRKVGAAWRKAMDEMAAGKVRATFEQSDIAQRKFSDDILLTPPKCKFCDYSTLCGSA